VWCVVTVKNHKDSANFYLLSVVLFVLVWRAFRCFAHSNTRRKCQRL